MRAATRLAGWLVLALAGCQTTDPDGVPSGAVPLALEQWQGDRLRCEWVESDCADWYRLEVGKRGDVVLRWQGAEGSAADAPWEVVVTDETGKAVGSPTAGSGAHEGGLAWKAEPGVYLVGVKTAEGEQSYQIRAEYRPEPPPPAPPPPPKPRFRWLRSEVLEVEGARGKPRAVLLDRGRSEGVASGQRGRLLDGKRTIAPLRIVDVYDEGCRAIIDGALEASITPQTGAEIEIPLEPR